MANNVFTYIKGSVVRYSQLPLGTEKILVVLLQSSGLQVDTTLRNHQTLSALLSAGNLEATFSNYVRKDVTGTVTITPDTTNSKMTVDMADQTWLAAGGTTNNTLGKFLVCYKPTATSLDSAILPLTYHDFTATTSGSDLLAQIATTGHAVAS